MDRNKVYETMSVTFDDGGIAEIVLNAPPVNCVSPELLRDLEQVTGELKEEKDLRAVVLTSANPKIFSAGADMKQFLSWDSAKGEEMSTWGYRIYLEFSRIQVPIVCAVEGGAYGGGLELALSTDIRVFAENAKVGVPECTLGVLPGYGGVPHIFELAGKGFASRMLYTGEAVSAEEALRAGICEYIAPKGETLAKAREVARKIASNGPIAIRAIKECLIKRSGGDVGDEPEFAENVWFGRLCDTKDRLEGVNAFLGKRKAEFKNE
ncbi:MAG: enoyl-CoA hydratase/isomerase family protein [Eubacterium sp.]|nr:enoyl-CoA hydratase/isomerase family protein [Eubacterium sp.]